MNTWNVESLKGMWEAQRECWICGGTLNGIDELGPFNFQPTNQNPQSSSTTKDPKLIEDL